MHSLDLLWYKLQSADKAAYSNFEIYTQKLFDEPQQSIKLSYSCTHCVLMTFWSGETDVACFSQSFSGVKQITEQLSLAIKLAVLRQQTVRGEPLMSSAESVHIKTLLMAYSYSSRFSTPLHVLCKLLYIMASRGAIGESDIRNSMSKVRWLQYRSIMQLPHWYRVNFPLNGVLQNTLPSSLQRSCSVLRTLAVDDIAAGIMRG